jgi:hypothetical protein
MALPPCYRSAHDREPPLQINVQLARLTDHHRALRKPRRGWEIMKITSRSDLMQILPRALRHC